jgi:hypothetical protein
LAYKLNPYYITGFVDGEGSFIITVNPNSRLKTGYRVRATFSIGLHERDLPLLKLIQNYFGVGEGPPSFWIRSSFKSWAASCSRGLSPRVSSEAADPRVLYVNKEIRLDSNSILIS